MDDYYNEDEQIETACELFEQYVGLLNQEFRDYPDAKKTGLECVTIANKLIELGFVVLAQIEQSVKTITPSNDTTQTILVFTYDLLLVPNIVPIQRPLMVAHAISRVFGPPMTSTVDHEIHKPISTQQETWLHSILDNLGTDKPDNNCPNKKGG